MLIHLKLPGICYELIPLNLLDLFRELLKALLQARLQLVLELASHCCVIILVLLVNLICKSQYFLSINIASAHEAHSLLQVY